MSDLKEENFNQQPLRVKKIKKLDPGKTEEKEPRGITSGKKILGERR